MLETSDAVVARVEGENPTVSVTELLPVEYPVPLQELLRQQAALVPDFEVAYGRPGLCVSDTAAGRVYLQPFAASTAFPTRLNLPFLPEEAQREAREALVADPEQVKNYVLEPLAQLPDWNDIRAAHPDHSLDEIDHLFSEARQAADLTGAEAIWSFLHNLTPHASIDALSTDDLWSINDYLEEAGTVVTEIEHYHRCLQHAATLLTQLAPDLTNRIQAVLPKIALCRAVFQANPSKVVGQRMLMKLYGTTSTSTTPPEYNPNQILPETNYRSFSTHSTARSRMLIIPNPREGYEDESVYVSTIVSLTHELAHVILDEICHELDPSLGNIATFDQGAADIHASLRRVLDEGWAQTVTMVAIDKLLSHDNLQGDQKQQIEQTRQEILHHIAQAASMWIPEQRRLLLGERADTVQIHQLVDLTYSEGYELFTNLQQRGWSLDQLPEFLRAVQEVIQKMFGDSSFTHLNTISVERSDSPQNHGLYERLMEKITHLRPPAGAT